MTPPAKPLPKLVGVRMVLAITSASSVVIGKTVPLKICFICVRPVPKISGSQMPTIPTINPAMAGLAQYGTFTRVHHFLVRGSKFTYAIAATVGKQGRAHEEQEGAIPVECAGLHDILRRRAVEQERW